MRLSRWVSASLRKISSNSGSRAANVLRISVRRLLRFIALGRAHGHGRPIGRHHRAGAGRWRRTRPISSGSRLQHVAEQLLHLRPWLRRCAPATRLSRFSTAQASSPSTSARTMRPLPFKVWKPRRNSLKAEVLSGSADQRGRYARRTSRTSSVVSEEDFPQLVVHRCFTDRRRQQAARRGQRRAG